MISVVIPCYKVKNHILSVIQQIGREVDKIYIVDDCCPEKSGQYVQQENKDPRVTVLFNPVNKGVGGAVIHGYEQALKDGQKIVVKVDGDGQMDPRLLPKFIAPILKGNADYTKGNRFYNLDTLHQMPLTRLLGNTGLSFLNKMVSGYWDIMDPTNGYTAIHTDLLRLLPLHKIANRYFFESDMLFRLNTIKAVVQDIPMDAKYGDEVSNLKIGNVLLTFPRNYLCRYFKRIIYNYYLRDFNLGSLFLVLGIFMTTFGTFYGFLNWFESYQNNQLAPTGTIMLAALTIILGFQSIIFFFQQDITSIPQRCIHLD